MMLDGDIRGTDKESGNGQSSVSCACIGGNDTIWATLNGTSAPGTVMQLEFKQNDIWLKVDLAALGHDIPHYWV